MSSKRSQIIDATIRLFAQEGVGVATAKIAKEANVSNGTLFNCFKTKQALVDTVYVSLNEQFANSLKGNFNQQAGVKTILYSIWGSYVNWSLEHDKEHKVVGLLKTSQVLSHDAIKAGESFFASTLTALEKAIQDKFIVNQPIEFVTEIISGQLNATINYIKKYEIQKDEVAKIIDEGFDICWKGIAINEEVLHRNLQLE